MLIISVRLEGPSESTVRQTAKKMGVQVSTVKKRTEGYQLYGTVFFRCCFFVLRKRQTWHPCSTTGAIK